MATLPAYGPAVWTDWTDNWRKADGDFLQSRSILRYATDAGKPASGEVGQVIFTANNSWLNVWNSKWIQVLSSENLNLVTSGTQARLTHPSAGGAGLLFSSGPNLITSEVDFKGSRIEASTVVVYTVAGGSNRTSRLTTTAVDLVSDSPVLAPSLTLNSPVTADVPYTLNISSGTLKVAGAATFGGAVTAAGAVQGSSVIISGDQVLALNAATRKDYVDSQRDTRVAKAGDTMTGMLTLPATVPSSNNHATNKKYVDDKAALQVLVAGDTMTGALAINEADGTHCLTMRTQATGAGGSLANTPYMSFTSNTATTRYGYLQGTPSGMILAADQGFLSLNAASNVSVHAATDVLLYGDAIRTYAAGVNSFTVGSGGIYVGKSTSDNAVAGTVIWNSGQIMLSYSGSVSGYYSIQTGSVAYAHHITFMRAGAGVLMSYIRNNGSLTGLDFPNCVPTPPSDGRLKDDLGSLTGALDKVNALLPKRLRWKSNKEEFDGFIAQEVKTVLPTAVVGDFDKPPEQAMIGIDFSRVTPWLVAAIQELATEVSALQELTERVTALEQAA